MMSFESEVIKLKMDEIFNKSSFFSISDVNDVAKVLGVNPSSHPDYKLLHALHCVHYTEMSAEMKAELPNRVMNVLSARFDTELMSRALIAVKNGEVNSLPPIEDVEVKERKLINLFKS